jgi:myo-inositol-1-phosphate synthase
LGKIKVAIIGVGNCASSLVQGVRYYQDASADDFVPGLMHVNLGGYHISDIEFVAAFDIDRNKVGKDLSEAIFTKQAQQHRQVLRCAADGSQGRQGHDA